MIGPRISRPKLRVRGMATRTPPSTSRTLMKVIYPVGPKAPMNIDIGVPSGIGGAFTRLNRTTTPDMINKRPSKTPAIAGRYFINLIGRTVRLLNFHDRGESAVRHAAAIERHLSVFHHTAQSII